MIWVSRSPFILLCLRWPSFNLHCELIKKSVWMETFLETLLLQDKCLAGTHKWTNSIWKMHPQTSYNLKWKLLSAFSTYTHHQLLATHGQLPFCRGLWRHSVNSPDSPESPARSETNLPCLWLWQGSGWRAHHPGIWATLACLCWGAWSNGSKHQPHSPCVMQPQ